MGNEGRQKHVYCYLKVLLLINITYKVINLCIVSSKKNDENENLRLVL